MFDTGEFALLGFLCTFLRFYSSATLSQTSPFVPFNIVKFQRCLGSIKAGTRGWEAGENAESASSKKVIQQCILAVKWILIASFLHCHWQLHSDKQSSKCFLSIWKMLWTCNKNTRFPSPLFFTLPSCDPFLQKGYLFHTLKTSTPKCNVVTKDEHFPSLWQQWDQVLHVAQLGCNALSHLQTASTPLDDQHAWGSQKDSVVRGVEKHMKQCCPHNPATISTNQWISSVFAIQKRQRCHFLKNIRRKRWISFDLLLQIWFDLLIADTLFTLLFAEGKWLACL